jgi:electron transfer flavoprotein beta subunit
VALRIVVLLKAVPPVGSERLDPSFRTVRAAALEANGNDEYTLEAALKLVEKEGGEITLVAVGPAGALDAIRKGLAMGATKAVHVQDDSIAGSDIRATVTVLAAALKKLEYDLVLAGADTSDGQAGVVSAALAVRLGLPYLSYASLIEPSADAKSVRVRRLSSTGYDVIEAATPALIMGTQLLGQPRYPALRGIMQARSKEIQTWSLADLGIAKATVGADAATTKVLGAEPPPERAGATVLREAPDAAVEKVVEFLAARRLV